MQGTMSAMSVLKLIFMTVFEDRTCPADECDYVLPENTPLCEHYIKTHTDLLLRNAVPVVSECVAAL